MKACIEQHLHLTQVQVSRNDENDRFLMILDNLRGAK